MRRAQTKHARHISHRSAAACIQQQQCCTEWTVFSNTDKQTNGCAQADIRRVRRAIEREGGEGGKFQLQLMYFSSQRSSGGLRKDDEEGSRTSNVRANDDEWSRGAALGAQKAHHCCCCKQIKKAAALFCVLLSKCFLLIFIRACALFLMRGKHCSQIAHRFSGEGEETLSLSLSVLYLNSFNEQMQSFFVIRISTLNQTNCFDCYFFHPKHTKKIVQNSCSITHTNTHLHFWKFLVDITSS